MIKTEEKKLKIGNVPNLRFPGFEGEWENRRLGDIANIYDGIHQTPKYVNEGVKFVSVENINNLDSTNKFITREAFEKEYKIKPKKGDILMTRITAGIIGATAIIQNNEPLAFYVSLALIRIKEKVEVDFLKYSIETDQFKKELNKRIIHVAFPKKINLGDIQKCTTFFPSLAEQNKIAKTMIAINGRIETQNKIIEELKTLKKALLKQIFTQELRFRVSEHESNAKWCKKNMGELFSFKLTNSLSRDKLNYEEGTVKNIHYGDIHTKFHNLFDLKREEVPYVNSIVDLNKILETSYCQTGDMIFADASEDLKDVGKSIEIINLDNQKLISGLHTILARPIENAFSIGFCGYLFSSKPIRVQIQKESQGTKVMSISANRLSSISLPLPTLNEQVKIINLLSSVDSKLHVINTQLQKYKEQKKFILSQMFV